MSWDWERRQSEWTCGCKDGNIRSQSCLKCLRCGADKPDPVTLGRACFALGVFLRAIDRGKSQEEAMQEALQEDANRTGAR